MKNWKLSKLRINNFKAFDKVEFDFESSSLLTLEGLMDMAKRAYMMH
ncbi:hypothetical protein BANRA_01545 [Klebsiella pneumoniae]|nr:hypothetical protein BANRA_01545 [Klebsiella pneumoniae]